jgi:hypothetical protein
MIELAALQQFRASPRKKMSQLVAPGPATIRHARAFFFWSTIDQVRERNEPTGFIPMDKPGGFVRSLLGSNELNDE